MKLDIPQIPELLFDNTDRNRTSPFAFTGGNRFRVQPSVHKPTRAAAMIALNAAMAEALIDFKTRVDALIANGVDKTKAILQVVREDIKTCKPIHFDGNGYSEEWQEEARRRGLDTERSCPLIFDRYLDESSVKMFETTHVFTRNEIEARNEIKWETYTKKVQVEARIFGDILHESHHSGGHTLPKCLDRQRAQSTRGFPCRDRSPAECQELGTDRKRFRNTRASSQKTQTGWWKTGRWPTALKNVRESHCLPRHSGSHVGKL